MGFNFQTRAQSFKLSLPTSVVSALCPKVLHLQGVQAAYMVTTAGQHRITVLAGGKPAAGSPFVLDVAPGQIRAGSCRLTGPGMHSVQLGREMRLAVRLADSFGNAIADPGALEAHDVQVRTSDRLEFCELCLPRAATTICKLLQDLAII